MSLYVVCYSSKNVFLLLHPVLCYSGIKCKGVVTFATSISQCCNDGGSYKKDFGFSCTSW